MDQLVQQPRMALSSAQQQQRQRRCPESLAPSRTLRASATPAASSGSSNLRAKAARIGSAAWVTSICQGLNQDLSSMWRGGTHSPHANANSSQRFFVSIARADAND